MKRVNKADAEQQTVLPVIASLKNYSMQMWGEMQFLPQNASETVFWPGSTQNLWGACNAPWNSLAGFKGQGPREGEG